ncbi:MAG: galactose mutarotase [Phycisphaerae bacterium]|nr:galactose mutarotase [Phycisphaerae bacterium]
MPIETSNFGTSPVLFTVTNARGLRAKITNYGATLVSLEAPDKNGKLTDIVLGYDSLEGYINDTCYLGCTVGRFANRIRRAKCTLDGMEYLLTANDKGHHLHGGGVGFNKRLWAGRAVEPSAVEFTYTSPAGEENYPGELKVKVVYTLTDANELKIDYTAVTDAPTIINLTNHAYWNLRGPAAGDILGHEVTIESDEYTAVSPELVPSGEIAPLAGTPLDFTTPHAVGERIAQIEGGYDHNFVVRGKPGELRPMAKVVEKTTGRVMDISATNPAIQFYTGNFLDGTVTGKGSVVYQKHFGLCLETQHYPDSPNHDNFPSVVLRPGETYRQTTVHKFSTL